MVKSDYEKLLRVDQAAQILNCSRSWIYQLINNGELPYLQIGKTKGYRIPARAVDFYFNKIATKSHTDTYGNRPPALSSTFPRVKNPQDNLRNPD